MFYLAKADARTRQKGGRKWNLGKLSMKKIIRSFLIAILILTGGGRLSAQQTNAFTYQGLLNNGGSPANGSYDIQFTLYETNLTGSAAAGPVTNPGVLVSNGLFTTQIDFGPGVFTGSNYWLDIALCTNGGESFTELTPRQPITPTPYAIMAGSASNLLGNLQVSQLTGTVPLGQLPAAVITNNDTGVTLSANNLSVSTTNRIAPLTVAPNLPTAAIGSVGTGVNPRWVAIAGRYAYVLNSTGLNLQIIDVSNPTNPVVVGFVSTTAPASCVVVAGRYAYLVAGNSTLQIVDVGNPSNPVTVSSVPTSGVPRSVAIAGHYAYVANNTGDSLQIFDVTDPANPVSVASPSSKTSPGQSIVAAGRYVYETFSGNTLQIYDVGAPTNPIPVGSCSTTGSGTLSIAVSGRYAYVVDNVLQIIDVSNPASPVVVGSTNITAGAQSVAVAGRYAYTANNGGVLQVFDVSNPLSPASVGTVPAGGLNSFVAVSGRYAFVANTSANNLQIFDLGGAYIQQLEAGSVETGTLQTRDTATVGNNLDVRGGLTVSASARISGGLGADVVTIGTNYATAGTEQLRIVRGIVSGAGTALFGNGYTVTYGGPGTYTINFTPPFSGIPTVTATAVDDIARAGGSLSTNSVTIGTLTFTGAPINDTFHFIAIGPQ